MPYNKNIGGDGYSYEILWEKDFAGGSGNMGAAVDSHDNVVVCGVNQGEDKGIVVKYDKNGKELWSDADLPGICNFFNTSEGATPVAPPAVKNILGREYGYFFDVAVDAEDNIIVAGTFTEGGGTSSIMYVKKYDPDGNAIWERKYSPFQINIASGIAVDGKGNIFVAGGGGSITSLLFKGVVLKISGLTGRIMWKSIRRKGMIAVYTGITSDSQGNAIAAGFTGSGSEENFDLTITKFGALGGLRRREITMAGNKVPTCIVYNPPGGEYIVAGKSGKDESHYLLKLGPYFNVLWEMGAEQGTSKGFLYGAGITGEEIVTSGYLDGKKEYYAALHSLSTGKKLLDMFLGECVTDHIDDYMRGVAVDSENNVIVTGARTIGKTMKIKIIQSAGGGGGVGGSGGGDGNSGEEGGGAAGGGGGGGGHHLHESWLEKILRWIFGR
jgi:hypothetical protein